MNQLRHLAKLVWRESRTLYRIGIFAPVAIGVIAELFGYADLIRLGSIVTVVLAIAWLVWVLADVTLRYEEQLRPKVSLEISERGSVVVTPEKVKHRETGLTLDEYQAVYVRFLVKALSAQAVRGCLAYLIDVRQVTPEGKLQDLGFVDPIQLPWSHVGVKPFDIPNKLGWYVDLLRADQRAADIKIASQWPLTLRGLFNESGMYRCSVLVSSGDGNSATADIDVTWHGQWDSVEARIAQ